jgi:hypothetical protein
VGDGNAFHEGSDSDDAAILCGMSMLLSRLVGGAAVVVAMLMLAADAWRRYDEAMNVPALSKRGSADRMPIGSTWPLSPTSSTLRR